AKLAIPLIIAGIFLSYLGEYFAIVAYVGVGCFALSALFQLVTLPVEFNASNRALAILDNSGNFSQKELRASKRVLSAAALTYVAALAVTLAQILRLLIIVLSHVKRKDD
ncbi:MAG: zinc metallopeptidase, partial [Clostridia bacterium]|nr:zinc metallopeptidase [Clostridia bacterium]